MATIKTRLLTMTEAHELTRELALFEGRKNYVTACGTYLIGKNKYGTLIAHNIPERRKVVAANKLGCGIDTHLPVSGFRKLGEFKRAMALHFATGKTVVPARCNSNNYPTWIELPAA